MKEIKNKLIFLNLEHFVNMSHSEKKSLYIAMASFRNVRAAEKKLFE